MKTVRPRLRHPMDSVIEEIIGYVERTLDDAQLDAIDPATDGL